MLSRCIRFLNLVTVMIKTYTLKIRAIPKRDQTTNLTLGSTLGELFCSCFFEFFKKRSVE